MIYVNKIKKIITFKIKTGCYLQLLMSETMKLLRSTKSKITKDRISESNNSSKSLLECTNLFSPNDYENSNKIILKCFQ